MKPVMTAALAAGCLLVGIFVGASLGSARAASPHPSDGYTLHIDADVRSGHITLITTPGIAVDADDVTVRSGHVKVRAPWGTVVPELLRIDVAGKCGSGHITARPPRRSFWQWLRRAPRPYAIAA